MKTLRIFISSPSDVAEEREKAKQVVARSRQLGWMFLIEAATFPLEALQSLRSETLTHYLKLATSEQ